MNRTDDGGSLYYSWLIVPLRVSDQQKNNTYFQYKNQHKLKLDDLTLRARSMFGNDSSAIGGVWRIEASQVLDAIVQSGALNWFTVVNKEYQEDPVPFSLYTSWVFSFQSGIAFFCLGIRTPDPMAVFMISDFGFLDQYAEVRQDGTKIDLRLLLSEWLNQKMGLKSFFENDTNYQEHIKKFFVDACIYNIALREERFPDTASIERAVHKLHLGVRADDPREDPSEEDVRFVYSTINLKEDVPGYEGLGSYRWGCCITSQTMNYLYGGIKPELITEKTIDDLLMEGLPLMILALQQRYRCFELTERMNDFSSLTSTEREALRDEMTEFIAYGTLSASAISRWYNVKQIYSHLIQLLDTEEAVADVTKKLDMLIKDADRRSQEATERTDIIISLFGLVAIPMSLIDLISKAISAESLWERCLSIGVLPVCLCVGMYLLMKRK